MLSGEESVTRYYCYSHYLERENSKRRIRNGVFYWCVCPSRADAVLHCYNWVEAIRQRSDKRRTHAAAFIPVPNTALPRCFFMGW
ncbi:hypothetical protein Ancab_028955, partial [Ancistrocladus abbreviatus]